MKERPRFKFHYWEIVFHVLFLGVNTLGGLWYMAGYSRENPPSQLTDSFLTPLLNRQRDNSDLQWEAYRSSVLLVGLCAILWKALSKVLGMKSVNEYSYLFGLILLVYCFRADIVFYLCVVLGWYYYTQVAYQYKHFALLSFAIVLAVLFLNEQFDHFRCLSRSMENHISIPWLRNIQSVVHWANLLNMTFLKLLSYSLDRTRPHEQRQLAKHTSTCQQCVPQSKEVTKRMCIRARSYHPVEDYGLKSYMNYVLFAPTLLTGPPVSYKNYMSFGAIGGRAVGGYVRWVAVVGSFELFQHYYPIMQMHPGNSLLEMECISVLHLTFIWYKFLIMWRAARIWAGAYGVEVVDNMGRCIFNNYGFEGFWRMWHRGFNLWLVRYIYVPLGGRSTALTAVGSTAAVVAFVAFWHDHTLNTVLWAAILLLFFLPQLLVKLYARRHWTALYPKQWFKYCSAAVAALYIYALVLCNVIGFGYGFKDSQMLLRKMGEEYLSLLWSYTVVVSACVLMFYTRDSQANSVNY